MSRSSKYSAIEPPPPYIEGAIFERNSCSDYWTGRYYFSHCMLQLGYYNTCYYITKCESSHTDLKSDVDHYLRKIYDKALYKIHLEKHIDIIKNMVKDYNCQTSIPILHEPIEVKTQSPAIQPAQKAYQKLLGV